MRNWRVLGAFCLLAGVLLVAGLGIRKPYTFRGSVIEPPAPAAELDLPASTGKRFLLFPSAGNVTLLFFGYTSCPDVCPVTLGEMNQLYQLLGEKSEKVSFVFVTVDPERDTVERLQKYLAVFNPAFIGLSGDMDELSRVWQAYDVTRQVDTDSSTSGPLISHSARLYLIDRENKLRLTYPFGTPVEDILMDILHLLEEE